MRVIRALVSVVIGLIVGQYLTAILFPLHSGAPLAWLWIILAVSILTVTVGVYWAIGAIARNAHHARTNPLPVSALLFAILLGGLLCIAIIHFTRNSN